MTIMLAQGVLVDSLSLAVTVSMMARNSCPGRHGRAQDAWAPRVWGVARCPTAQQGAFRQQAAVQTGAHMEPQQPDAEDRPEGVGPATDSPMERPSVITLVTPSWLQRYIETGSHHSVAERCTLRARRAGSIPNMPYSGPPKLARAWLRLQMLNAKRACAAIAPHWRSWEKLGG